MDLINLKGGERKCNITKEDVRNFRGRCIYARSLFMHHCNLFDSATDVSEVLKRTAPLFFGDVCHAFREQIFLQVCTLTDPANSSRSENLTVEFFTKNINFESDRMRYLCVQLHLFRNKIKPARDKIIAHYDRKTSLDNRPLGATGMESWYQFWINLQEFVYILSEKYLNEKVLINGVSNSTDIPALITILQQGGEGKRGQVETTSVKA